MSATSRARAALAASARAAMSASALMALLGVHAAVTGGPAAAADGPQGPLTLVPDPVEAAGDAFGLRPPLDARCEEDGTGSRLDTTPGPRSGADYWRYHGFIVEADRDVATLRFTALGPGDDFDATDGTITAPLLTAGGEGVWQRLPAVRPKGHINPDDLAGLDLDPAIYTLPDGDYIVGVACTDTTLAPRQWWTLTVTVDTGGGPFLTAATSAGTPGAAAALPSASESTDPSPASTEPAAGQAGTSTAGTPPSGTAAAPDVPVAAPPDGADVAAVGNPAGGSTTPTGVSWSPLAALPAAARPLPAGGWALLAAVFARIAYLLATPVHVLPPVAP